VCQVFLKFCLIKIGTLYSGRPVFEPHPAVFTNNLCGSSQSLQANADVEYVCVCIMRVYIVVY
jgi:hypothetical protein